MALWPFSELMKCYQDVLTSANGKLSLDSVLTQIHTTVTFLQIEEFMFDYVHNSPIPTI